MEPITYIDRSSGELKQEKVYYGEILQLLYGSSLLSKIAGRPFLYAFSRFPLISALVGWWNSLGHTKKNIQPFIQQYGINSAEFKDPSETFESFNDFFTRKLKPESRPLVASQESAIIPADGRYLFFPDISQADGFLIKGSKFKLNDLLQDENLEKRYREGSMAIARLCPTDYHRYHFPVNCVPGKSRLINGYWYSVNPLALKQNIDILTSNKRMICPLQSDRFKEVLFIEVGATNVGSIRQTYTPGNSYQKGDEKGYFSFGASTLILLFEPGAIQFDADLLAASANKTEIFCLMGQRMGVQ